MVEKNSVTRHRFGLFTTVLGAAVLLPLIGGVVLFYTFDPNQYRAEIAQFASEKLGRKISLNGTMRLKLAGGLALEVNDLALANPAWAARPEMAKIGQMTLAIKFAPLLEQPRRLEVETVTLSDADVQLETNAKGEKNWEFALAPAQDKNVAASEPTDNAAASAPGKVGVPKLPLAITLDKLVVKNFRFAMLAAGKPQAMALSLKELTLKAKEKTDLAVTGLFNAAPFTVSLSGAHWQELLEEQVWPFTLAAQYMGNKIDASGNFALAQKAVDFTTLTVASALGSTITGNLAVRMAEKPVLNGTLAIDKVALASGAAAPAAAAASETAETPAAQGTPVAPATGRLFSEAKLPFALLHSADAKLALTIGVIDAGKLALENLATSVVLENGTLRLPKITAQLAGNALTAALQIKAAPPAVSFSLNGEEMNLQPVLQALGQGAITLGKTSVAIDTQATGDNVRQLAGSLDGSMVLKLGRSQLPTAALGPVVNNLLKLLSPGSPLAAQNMVNCGTVRFKANNGVLNSHGILFDSSLATVAGEGTIDLRAEQVKLVFQPQAKDSKLAALTTPVRVGGALTQPQVAVDSAGALVGVVGSFLGKDLPIPVAKAALKVPVVNPALPDACTAALDNPSYAPDPAASSSVAGGALEQGRAAAQEKVKGLTDKLDKALGDKAPALKNLLGGEKSPLKGLFGQ